MPKVKGQNFRFLENGSAIPEETSVSITLSGNTEAVNTKDSEGMYKQEDVISTSFSINVDTFQAEVAQIKAIARQFNAAQPIAVGWDMTGGAQNRIPQNAPFKRSGNALLNDIEFTFNDRANITSNLQFQGTGALS